jgi:acyl-CoA thioesterase II
MGDFERDTRVEGSRGRYAAVLSADWDIWGPNGGYLAAIALRAAGAEAEIRRPASFAAHYLSVAKFAAVEIDVVVLRRGRRSESLRVSIRQEGRAILEALVRTAAPADALVHDDAKAPAVPAPDELKSSDELFAGEAPRFAFWQNLEQRPTHWAPRNPPRPGPPEHIAWHRFRPRATFEDPFVDAARALLLIDTMIWPAAWRRHVPADYYAPSLDVTAWFHRSASGSEWLLSEAHAPVAEGGLIGGTTRVWTEQGLLMASGGAQLACVSAAGFGR